MDDMRAFFGGRPPYSMRSLTLEVDGEAVAIGGVGYRDAPLAFLQMKDTARGHKVSLARFGRRLVETFGDREGLTIAEPGEPTADRFLRWLGFEYLGSCVDGEVYRWGG